MQIVKINNIDYNIPTSWDELTYEQAVNIIKNVDDKDIQLCSLSGIPLEVLYHAPDSVASKLFTYIQFTEQMEVFESEDILDEYKSFDFGAVEYGESEAIRKYFTGDKTGFEIVIDIVKRLVNYDISQEPFLKVIGTANFFLSRSISSIVLTKSLARSITNLSNYKQELKGLANSEASVPMSS